MPWHTARSPVTRIGDAAVGCTDAWGRVANDVLTLSRPEIGELAEGEGGGSSTMPHKRNPVLSTLLHRAALAAPHLAATLHIAAADSADERSAGAWQAEWATVATLVRRTVVAGSQATELLSGLEVHTEPMAATLAAADVGSEQSAMAELAGRAPAEHYLGAADEIIDTIVGPGTPVAEGGGARVIPAITAVRLTGARHRAELPLLVLGPSLGTSATALWSACATHLTDAFDVVAWDLPGHGHNRSVPEEPFTMGELAAGVLEVVDTLLEQRGETGGSFAYAGDSVGGAVGVQLMLDVPGRVGSAVLLCTGARIGDQEMWSDRIDQVRGSGTSALVEASAERWFGPGFLDREPERGSALLHALQEADDGGYCQVCGAIADFDVRNRLDEIGTPVLAVAGATDVATPTDGLRAIADGVKDGRLVELGGVAHLAPASTRGRRPAIRQHVLDEEARPGSTYDAGLAVRREVLGNDHVDRAGATTTELTREFQELITTYAWRSIATGPASTGGAVR